MFPSNPRKNNQNGRTMSVNENFVEKYVPAKGILSPGEEFTIHEMLSVLLWPVQGALFWFGNL